MNKTFASLQNKNFRLYFFGNLLSVIGNFMQNIALPWVALLITNSAWKVALIGTVQLAPTLIVTLFSGVIIDELDKRKVLLATQFGFVITTAVLSILTLSGKIEYWMLIVISIILGILTAVDMPARSAIINQVIPKELLGNALAMNTAAINSSRVIGPAIGGVLMTTTSPGFLFLLNSFSFVLFFIFLFFIKTEKWQPKPEKVRIIEEIKEGLLYVARNRLLSASMLFIFVFGALGYINSVALPVFAKITLGLSESKYGLVMAMSGVGALIGILIIASNSDAEHRSKFFLFAPFATGIAMILQGVSRSFWGLTLFTFLWGFAMVFFAPNANGIIQTNTDTRFVGRALAVYTFMLVGSGVVGNMLVGWLGDHVNVPSMYWVPGLILLVFFAVVYTWEKRILRLDRMLTINRVSPETKASMLKKEKQELSGL